MKILVALLMMSVSALAWDKVETSDHYYTWAEIANNPIVAWVIFKLDQAGYEMPKDNGNTFQWGDYFTPLDPAKDTPQENDLCIFYDENQHKVGALVMDTEGGQVTVQQPIEGGIMYIIHNVDMNTVWTFFRPHKKDPSKVGI